MRGLTAHGSARWSGPLHVGVSLPLRPVQNRPAEDAFQLFGVRWGDGVSADGQLHQGQPHAPHVRLNRVVSALQSLRLLRNRQSMSERQVEPRCQGGKGEAQEVDEGKSGRGREGGRQYGEESWGVVRAKGQRMGGLRWSLD